MYEFHVEAHATYESQQSQPSEGLFRFAYTITITNTGKVAAQLIARHWWICDDEGHIQEVHGLGVVGRQPLLQPGESFQYSSGCELPTPGGSMQGHYLCLTEDAKPFDAPVAPFALSIFPAEGQPLSSNAPHSRTLH